MNNVIDLQQRRPRLARRPSGSPPRPPLSALVWELVTLAIADHERSHHGGSR